MAKTVCKILGVVFLLVGLIGFASPHLLNAHLSAAHNVVHIVSGAIALVPDTLEFGTADHGIHILLGVIFLAGGLFTKRVD